jgi:hypothetical protein
MYPHITDRVDNQQLRLCDGLASHKVHEYPAALTLKELKHTYWTSWSKCVAYCMNFMV